MNAHLSIALFLLASAIGAMVAAAVVCWMGARGTIKNERTLWLAFTCMAAVVLLVVLVFGWGMLNALEEQPR